ncbi:VIP peptides-like [Glossophaga mutica]
MGDRIPYEGAKKRDQPSLKAETYILQNALAKNYDVSRNARHADAVFTNDYSRLLGQISAKKYLESLIGKWVGNDILEDQGPVKRHSDAVFTDNYSRLLKNKMVREFLEKLLQAARILEDND